MEHSKLTRAKRLADVEKEAKSSLLRRLVLYGAVALAAAGVLWLIGAKIHGSMQAKEAVRAQERVAELISAGPSLFGQTRQEIYARLGKPDRVDDSVVRDFKRRKGWDQIIYKIIYNGVFLEVQRLRPPGEPERETLSQLTISGAGPRLKYDIGVGMSRKRLRGILGAPVSEEPDRDIYEESGVYRRQLRFVYTGETVTAIEWRF